MAARLDPLTTPRGHLPARVYWIRRAVVLGLPLLLLVVLISVLTGGGGGTPTARLAGATERSQAPSAAKPRPTGPVVVTATAPNSKHPSRATPSASPTALAAPDGPCAADEITVTPSVSHAKAGGAVTISVQLRTARPACTFAVSASSLAVKVTSGSDGIWSSQVCRGSVPQEQVVVRSAKPAVVPVTWNGRRITDGTCGATNTWARPGYYHALAAVIGSEPTDVQFGLSLPPRPVVTRTAHPKPTKSSPGKQPSKGQTSKGAATGAGSSCGGDNAAGTC